jgi:hypothetical protein
MGLTISIEVRMDFFEAKRIFDASLSMDAALNQIDAVISKIADDGEREVWIIRLGHVMRAINEQLINPTLDLYPELENSKRF